jgi:lysyl-tRNA synthetase class II
MPACAGVALGIDRLHQWLVQAASIREVLVFPFDRA